MFNEDSPAVELLPALKKRYAFVVNRVKEVMAITEIVLEDARTAFNNIEPNFYNRKDRVKISVYTTFYSSYMGQYYFEIIPILIIFYLGFVLLKDGRIRKPRYKKLKEYILGWANSEYWYHDTVKGKRRGASNAPAILCAGGNELLNELPPDIKEMTVRVLKNIEGLKVEERKRGSTGSHARMWLKHRMLVNCIPYCSDENMYRGCTDETRFKLPFWSEFMAKFRDSVEISLGNDEEEFPYLKESFKTLVLAIEDAIQ